ncbi:MAG: hypothetical protein ACRENG_33200, partial [bacterium]
MQRYSNGDLVSQYDGFLQRQAPARRNDEVATGGQISSSIEDTLNTRLAGSGGQSPGVADLNGRKIQPETD